MVSNLIFSIVMPLSSRMLIKGEQMYKNAYNCQQETHSIYKAFSKNCTDFETCNNTFTSQKEETISDST